MTILFLSRLFLPHIGGVETHITEVSKILISQGHKVVVVTEDTSLPSRSGRKLHTVINGIEVWYIPVGSHERKKKWRIWRWMWYHQSLIQSADVIHCHDVFFWYLPFRFLYPRKKVFTTFHGYERYPISPNAKIVRKISEKLSMGNVCIGDFIPKWYGTKPNYVSYGGVDSSEKEILTLPAGRPEKQSAVFIGRLDEQTGILDYTKAVELIRNKYPKFELLVVGEGKYKEKLPKTIKMMGAQVNPQRFLATNRFAFVSRYLSILEAIAAKRLVFALYDDPIKKDYLKMAPFAKFICIENTPEALAKRVIYILKHPDVEDHMIQQGYQWVRKQSWYHMVDLYLALWGKK